MAGHCAIRRSSSAAEHWNIGDLVASVKPLLVSSIPTPRKLKTMTYSVFLRCNRAGYFKHAPRAVLRNCNNSKSRIAVCTDCAMCRSQLRSSVQKQSARARTEAPCRERPGKLRKITPAARPTAARRREARSSLNRLSVSIRFELETNIVGALSAERKMGRREKPEN